MSEIPPSFRGVFHASEDPEYWQEAMEEFPNRVPRFKSKEATVNFIKTYCQIGSNPDEPHLRQSVTVMTMWSQIERHLLPKIQEYRNKWAPKVTKGNMMKKNRYMSGETVKLGIGGSSESNTENDDDRERAIKEFLKKSTMWRRYQTEDGRIYYHDKSTKATEWKMPTVLSDFLAEYDAKKMATSSGDVDVVKGAEGSEPGHENGAKEEKVSARGVYSYLQSRLDLPIHRQMNHHSALNTLKYLFFHMRCGIYVMIRNNEVSIFAPFVNKDYRNNWAAVDPAGQGLKLESIDGSISAYYAEKENHYRRENVLEDISEWWANGNIICNEHEKPDAAEGAGADAGIGVVPPGGDNNTTGNTNNTSSQYWGDQFLLQLKDMLAETCRLRDVPDCEFFINKRDYPQLKVHEGASTSSSGGIGGDGGDGDGSGDGSGDGNGDGNGSGSGDGSGDGGNAAKLQGQDLSVDMMRLGKGDPILEQEQERQQELRKDMPVEPYGFIFDRDDTVPGDDIPLSRYYYSSYAPILSFYTSKRFADIPMPPSEDWEAACGDIFPPSFNYSLERAGNAAAGVLPELSVGNPRDLFTADNLRKFDTPWKNKVNTAFFRGTATGGGTTVKTNQRLHVAQVCYDWEHSKSSSSSSGSGGGSAPPLLDAKITGWNMRDKKVAASKMTFVRKADFSFEGDRKKNFVEIYKQSSYKYLLYIEGHCAACRYGFMMQLGSVILKVESLCVADSMWYFPLLQPYYDHIPVKADLSDLKEKIMWCRGHDEECQKIAVRAQALYKTFVGREGILDYMQTIMCGISSRWKKVLPFGEAPAPLPVITRGGSGSGSGGGVCCLPNCNQGCEHVVCLGCVKIQEQEREVQAGQEESKQQLRETKEEKKAQLKQRRRENAAALKASRQAPPPATTTGSTSTSSSSSSSSSGRSSGGDLTGGSPPSKKFRVG